MKNPHIVLKVPKDGTDIKICRWNGAQQIDRRDAMDRAKEWSIRYPAYTYIAVPVTP